MPVSANIVPTGSLARFGARDPINSDAAFATGKQQVQEGSLEPYALNLKRADMINQADAAKTALELRPLETSIRKKKLEAEGKDIDETAAAERYVARSSAELKGLLLDLEKGLFPTTAARMTSEANTAANEASIGLGTSQVKLKRLDDLQQVTADEITNMKAKVAIEGGQLLRLKDDPTGLKRALGEKLVEVGVIYSPDESANSMYEKWKTARADEIETLERIAKLKTSKDPIEKETGLRKEYEAGDVVTKSEEVFRKYANLKVSAGKPAEATTAIDDISTVFSYMKMLDPGSTVREGEAATLQQAAGFPARVVTMYNQAVKGDKLAPSQRQEIVSAADDLAKSYQTQLKRRSDQFQRLAEVYGVNADNVVNPVPNPVLAPPASLTAPPTPANATSPRKRVKLKDGRIVFGHFVKNPKSGATEFEIEEIAK